MESNPLVSVVLPAYNAESTLAETIQSIVNQTYSNWELIIINDGSTDGTEQVVKSFNDPRIKYFMNDGNKKLIYTLNRGLSLAKGKYIARMDADDICMPSRFEKQVAFLESHPEVIICGTQIKYFGTKSTGYRKLVFPTKDKQLKEMLAMSSCFAHPTVMIRKTALDESGVKYDADYKNAEDYCLWIDLMDKGKYHVLNEQLLQYRISDTQISQPSNPQTEISVLKCKRKYALKYLPEELVERLFSDSISVSTIKDVKSITTNKKIIEACYLSLNKYGIQEITYLMKTFDFAKLGAPTVIRFIKRLLFGFAPIYYNSNANLK